VLTVPQAMGAPSEGAATSSTQIQVTWSALTTTVDIGGTAITSYQLDWDEGTPGTWAPLVGASSDDTSTSFVQTAGVVAGSSYQFRLRAENQLGWGSYGPSLTVIPSSPPS
jgi:hypothetical protein